MGLFNRMKEPLFLKENMKNIAVIYHFTKEDLRGERYWKY